MVPISWKVAELDVQHLVFPVIIVANWVTLLRYAVVDPCYQSPSLLTHLQPTKIYFSPTLAKLLYLTQLPKITINITTLNGTRSIALLPDSDADVSAAGEAILHHLNEHFNNLLRP